MSGASREEGARRASVVVATRNRSGSLAALLGALESQTLGRGEFEIIVVDDASSDATAATVERHAERTAGRL
ncbi:MAG: glycosyltransferase, partial [Candidatus Binatia bacterium]